MSYLALISLVSTPMFRLGLVAVAEEPTGPGGTVTGRLVPRMREEEGTGPATTVRSA